MNPKNPEKMRPKWLDQDAYPFAAQSFTAPGESGQMHYLDEFSWAPNTPPRPEPHTILFVHGTPTWSFEYRHLVKALRCDFRCIAPDHLGFGLSDQVPGADYRPEAHAKRLRALTEHLGLQDFTLIVHDFGGPIGLPLALDPALRVRRIVIINSWMWGFTDDPVMQKRAKLAAGGFARFLYRYLNFSVRILGPSAWGDKRKLTKEIQQQYLAPFRARWPREEVLWALARALTQSNAYYEALWHQRECLRNVPMLLLWGMKDHAFGPPFLSKFRAEFPHANIKELPNAGHWPHEEEPTETIRAVREFLASTL
ncbi:MAG: alpha/beta fold hydrolase [Polyangiaceae bacterium]|nr:alpha/beta fold hydrolase [Polyangiaceae bacterium]